jgi:hypothetical protein
MPSDKGMTEAGGTILEQVPLGKPHNQGVFFLTSGRIKENRTDSSDEREWL